MSNPSPRHPALPLLQAGKRDEALAVMEQRGDAKAAEALLRHHADTYALWLLEDWRPPAPTMGDPE